MIGKTIGKYRVVERLGRGGMGTVYKAVDETLDREVAIKVLNPDLGDPEVLKRFRAEAVTLARLNHPGIATIYELDRNDDELLMVMEFVRGETFQEMSERLGPLAVPQAAHLCSQVLDALGHAHRAGIVHRDLKPANLMIADSGAIKVMDFGIARVLGTEHVTHAGYMMGTPAYMAPEQVLGQDVDGRADVYAMGVVLYRLLTGQLPFRADTAVAMVQKQLADEPTPLSTFRPDLPPWCALVISRAMAKSPAERFQTSEEFRAALSGAVVSASLGELPTYAEPTPHGLQISPELQRAIAPKPEAGRDTGGAGALVGVPLTAGGAPVPQQPARTEGVTTTVVLGRRHLVALGAVATVLVIGVIVLAYLTVRRGQPGAQVTSTPSAITPPAPAAPPVPEPAGGADARVATPQNAPAPEAPASAIGETPVSPGSAPLNLPAADAAKAVQASRGRAGIGSEAKRIGRGTPAIQPLRPAPAAALPTLPAVPVLNPALTHPTVSFPNVRLLVADGDKTLERDGLLLLDQDRLTILDRPGGKALASQPYSAVTSTFYSRSKQPRWRDAQGKEGAASVKLGKLGFLKADRNWLIVVTAAAPVIFRCEDGSVTNLLSALQERSGVPVQRFAGK